jgi:hypothetical protein
MIFDVLVRRTKRVCGVLVVAIVKMVFVYAGHNEQPVQQYIQPVVFDVRQHDSEEHNEEEVAPQPPWRMNVAVAGTTTGWPTGPHFQVL